MEADLRKLLAIPGNYKVLFLQGGATAQFAAIPLNLLRGKTSIDVINTGEWSKKSIKEAKKYCKVNVAASGEDKGFTYGVRTSFDFRQQPGPFTLQVSVHTAATGQAIAESIGEIRDIRGARPVTADELEMGVAAHQLRVARFQASKVRAFFVREILEDLATAGIPGNPRRPAVELSATLFSGHRNPERVTGKHEIGLSVRHRSGRPPRPARLAGAIDLHHAVVDREALSRCHLIDANGPTEQVQATILAALAKLGGTQ